MEPVPFINPPATVAPIPEIAEQRPDERRFGRRLARRRAQLRDDDDGLDQHEPHPLAGRFPVDPAQPLLEALDRLRVTQDLRPVEHEYARALRAVKAYQDPTTRIYAKDDPSASPPG